MGFVATGTGKKMETLLQAEQSRNCKNKITIGYKTWSVTIKYMQSPVDAKEVTGGL
jgi:hypothetical protein